MTANSSRRARQLAAALTERTKTPVRLEYHDSLGGPRAWHIHWTDGPTWRQMLGFAAIASDGVDTIDLARVRPARSHSPLGEAVAVLRWLREDIANADLPPGVWAEFARDGITYPEQVSERTRARGEALLSLGDGRVSVAACQQMSARINGDDLDVVFAWLDEIAAGAKPLRAVQ